MDRAVAHHGIVGSRLILQRISEPPQWDFLRDWKWCEQSEVRQDCGVWAWSAETGR